MKKQKAKAVMDFGTLLLVTGALANVTLWIGAFVSTEAQGPVSVWVREYAIPLLGGISGLAMGITVAAGLVYVLSRLSKMQPTIERKVRGKDETKSSTNFRFWGAAVAIVLLLIISPALLAPYVYMTISNGESLFVVLGMRWSGAWSIGRIVAADLALGAIALVHGVQFGAVAGAKAPTQSDKGATRTPKKSMRGAVEMRLCEYGCGMSYRWPQGKGAHMKKYHIELCIPKAVLSLPTRKEEKR